MMKNELNSITLTTPKSWSDIKLSDYERFYLLNPETKIGLIEYVAKVCNIDVEVLLESPTQVFDSLANKIAFVFNADFAPISKVEIDNKDYFISTSDKLTLGEWVDIEGVIESDSENKLSEILAIICRPIGVIYDREYIDTIDQKMEIFKNLPCDKALPLISFFLLKKKKSEEISRHCLAVVDQANQLLHHTKAIVQNGVGTKQLPIWQRINYYYLTRSLSKELSKFSDSYFIK